MKAKRTPISDKIDLNMTPMIDIVFQLMTFFLFSIKTVDTEGSFNIKMPTPSKNVADPESDPAFPVPLVMTADARGWLTSVTFKGGKYSVPVPGNTDGLDLKERMNLVNNASQAFDNVHKVVQGMVGNTQGPGGAKALEIELDCSPNLKYSYVIQAINSVSGHRQSNGTITPLIEKIKFKPRLGAAK